MKKIFALLMACSLLLLTACGGNSSSSEKKTNTTTSVSEKVTEATKKPTEKPTEKVTEKPTEATEKPTEKAEEKETEKINNESGFNETTSFEYKNKIFNYTMKFPAEWRKTLAIEELSDSVFVTFSYLGAFEDKSVSAILFTIHIMNKSEYDPNNKSLFPKWKYIAESGNKVAICLYPTDVQYDPTYAEGTKNYKECQSQIESILKTFKFN